jgi:flagellar hook-length control protein FliK
VSSVTLPVTAGTVRAASLHPDNRANEHAATPFASLLDTGTGPQIVERPAPRPERSRAADNPAHANTAPQKPTRVRAKDEAPDETSPAPQDPPAGATGPATDELAAAIAIDPEAVETAETDPEAPEVAAFADPLVISADGVDVTAGATTAAPATPLPATPVQPLPVELAPAPQPVADGEPAAAIAAVTTEVTAPVPDAATIENVANVLQPQPHAVAHATKIETKLDKTSDTGKAAAADGDDVSELVTTDMADVAPEDASKKLVTHAEPRDEAPVERRTTATPGIEAPAETPAATRAAVHTDPAASPAARPDFAAQAGTPLATAANQSAAIAPQMQAQTAAAVPVSGLAVEIVTHARDGKNRFEIRLDPPELGRVDVRLDIDGQGNVTSRLVVERQDTLDLLRRESTALERALNDAGLKTGNDGLQFSLRDQGSDNHARRDDTGGRVARVMVPVDAAVGPDPSAYRLPRLGGLDIRV